MRLRNIDLLKGILILLVIVGHIALGHPDHGFYEPRHNFLRYAIYSFHMPLFIGISGFLFNSEKMKQLSFGGIINKYLFRMLIPWAIAMIVYTVTPNFETTYSLPSLLFFIPFYHLWFVVAYLMWIIVMWALLKADLKLSTIFWGALIVSIGTKFLLEYPNLYNFSPLASQAIETLLRTFKPFFFIFFVTGMVFKKVDLNAYLQPAAVGTILGALGFSALFFAPSLPTKIILFYLFNGAFLAFLLALAQKDRLPYSNLFEWMGKNSLAIYLWHMLPIILIQHLIGEENHQAFYLYTMVAETIWIGSIWLLSKNKTINRYLFGM